MIIKHDGGLSWDNPIGRRWLSHDGLGAIGCARKFAGEDPDLYRRGAGHAGALAAGEQSFGAGLAKG